MECLKCGRAAESRNVFCKACLEDMAKTPVKAGTALFLPTRPAVSEKPTSGTRERTPSETISSLRSLIRVLTVTVAVLSVLLCATAGFLIHTLEKQEETNKIGWNYATNTDLTNP